MSQNLSLHGNPVGYRGVVTIKTLQNDKVVSKQIFQNKGLPKFFYNICELIATANLRRENLAKKLPAYLRLYTLKKKSDNGYVDYQEGEYDIKASNNNKNIGDLISNEYSWHDIVDEHMTNEADCRLVAATNLLPPVERLQYRPKDAREINTLEVANDEQGRAYVSLQWKIRTQNITENKIFMMALFSGEVDGTDSGSRSHWENALAYYKLTSKTEGGQPYWNPVSVDKSAYDFSIIVEWKLEFDNAGNYGLVQNAED
jgi:hypothetical protein